MNRSIAIINQKTLNQVSKQFFDDIFTAYRIKLKDGSYIVAVQRIKSEYLLELDCFEEWDTRKVRGWLEAWVTHASGEWKLLL